jgi:sugar phosphate permease
MDIKKSCKSGEAENHEMPYRWIILFLVFFAFMVSFLSRMAVPPMMGELIEFFKLTGAEAGMLMTSFWVGYFLMQFPGGIISDKIGYRTTIVISSILTAIFCFLTSLITSYNLILIVRFINGLVCGFMFAPGMALLYRWFPERQRATAMGVYMIAPLCGVTICMIFSALLSAKYGGWATVFRIWSLFPLIAAVLCLFLIKDSPPISIGISQISERVPIRKAVAILIKNPFLICICIVFFGFMYATTGTVIWAPKYITDILKVSSQQGALVAAILTSVAIFFAPLAGVIADKIKGKLLFIISFFILTGLIIASLGVLPLSDFGFGIVIPIFFILGVVHMFPVPALMSLIPSVGIDIKMYGAASGLVNFIGQIGAAVSPLIFGYVLDISGYALAWIILGAGIILMSFFVIPLFKKGL